MITEKQADRIIALLERIAESVERPTILGGTTVHFPIGIEPCDPLKMVPFSVSNAQAVKGDG